MSSTTAAVGAPAPSRLADPVGARLAVLAERTGSTCVLEDDQGHVVSHATRSGDLPSCVVDAVLSRLSRPLHAALTRPRTLGLAPGGPVVSGTFGAVPVVVAPVDGVGHVWLVGRPDHALDLIAEAGQDLADVVLRSSTRATDERLLAALMECTQPRESTWVAVIRPQDGLLDPVRIPHVPGAQLTATCEEAYLVLDGTADPVALVNAALERFACSGYVVGAVVCSAERGLAAARADAAQALDARCEPGRCLTLDECRPYITHARLLAAVAEPSPLDDLDECLAVTLLAWLDAHGDTPAAARALDVHANTFRYRLSRAQQLAGDLQDPVVRIDLHLRLRARLSSG